METNKNIERANTILKEIEKLIKEYNSLDLRDKIVYKRKTKGKPKDVKNLYVCEYNSNSVGLIDFFEPEKATDEEIEEVLNYAYQTLVVDKY